MIKIFFCNGRIVVRLINSKICYWYKWCKKFNYVGFWLMDNIGVLIIVLVFNFKLGIGKVIKCFF